MLVMSANSGAIVADIAVAVSRDARTESALADIRTTLKHLLLEETP